MSELQYTFDAEIWRYSGKATWYFVTVPKDISEHIKIFVERKTPGFGSIRLKAKIGSTVWKTSIFPDKKTGSYFLPIKADIRKKEALSEGIQVSVELEFDVS